MAKSDKQVDLEQDLADSRYPQQQEKRVRVYEDWKGNEVFFCCGLFMGGPGWKASLLTGFFILVPAVLFLYFIAFQLRNDTTLAPGIIGAFLTVVSLYFLFVTAFSDPGIIPRQEPDLEGRQGIKPGTKDVPVNGHTVTIRYNATCNFYQPPRAHHCSVNDNCIERFDHHCPWVGTTIGLRNYRSFLLFIHITSLLCLYVVAFCTLYAVKRALAYVHDYKQNNGGATPKPHLIVRNNGIPWAMALFLFGGCGFLFVGCLTFFHLWLISKNQTTYENFRYASTKRQNPYDRGFCNNCKEVWFLNIPKSRIQARRFKYDVEQPKGDLPINMYLREPYSDYNTKQLYKYQELQERGKSKPSVSATNSTQSRNIQFVSNSTNYSSGIKGSGDQQSHQVSNDKGGLSKLSDAPKKEESNRDVQRPLPDEPSKIHYVQASKRGLGQVVPERPRKSIGKQELNTHPTAMSQFDSSKLFMPSHEDGGHKAISIDSDDSDDSSPRFNTKSGNQKRHRASQDRQQEGKKGVISIGKALNNKYVKPSKPQQNRKEESTSNASQNDSVRDGKHLLGSELSYDSVSKQYKMSDTSPDRPVENASLFRQEQRQKGMNQRGPPKGSPQKQQLHNEESTDQARDTVRRQYMHELQEHRNKQRGNQTQPQRSGRGFKYEGGKARQSSQEIILDEASDKSYKQSNLVGSDRNLGDVYSRRNESDQISNRSRSLLDLDTSPHQTSGDSSTTWQNQGSNLGNNRHMSNLNDVLSEKNSNPGYPNQINTNEISRQSSAKGSHLSRNISGEQYMGASPQRQRGLPTVTPMKSNKSREKDSSQKEVHKGPSSLQNNMYYVSSEQTSGSDPNFEISLKQQQDEDKMPQQPRSHGSKSGSSQIQFNQQMQAPSQKPSTSPRSGSGMPQGTVRYDRPDSSMENAEFRKQTRLRQMERLRRDDRSSQDSLKKQQQKYQSNLGNSKGNNNIMGSGRKGSVGDVQPSLMDGLVAAEFNFPSAKESQMMAEPSMERSRSPGRHNYRNNEKGPSSNIPKGIQDYNPESLAPTRSDLAKRMGGRGGRGNRAGDRQSSPSNKSYEMVGSNKDVDLQDQRRARLKKLTKEIQDNNHRSSMQGQIDRIQRQRMGKEIDDSMEFAAYRGTGSDFDRVSNLSLPHSNPENIMKSREDRSSENSWKLQSNEILSSSKARLKQLSHDLQILASDSESSLNKRSPQTSQHSRNHPPAKNQDPPSAYQQNLIIQGLKEQQRKRDLSNRGPSSGGSSSVSKMSRDVQDPKQGKPQGPQNNMNFYSERSMGEAPGPKYGSSHSKESEGMKDKGQTTQSGGQWQNYSRNGEQGSNDQGAFQGGRRQEERGYLSGQGDTFGSAFQPDVGNQESSYEMNQVQQQKQNKRNSGEQLRELNQYDDMMQQLQHQEPGQKENDILNFRSRGDPRAQPKDQNRFKSQNQLEQINEVLENTDNSYPYKLDYDDNDEEESFYNSQNIIGGAKDSDLNRSSNNLLNQQIEGQQLNNSQSIRGSGKDIERMGKNNIGSTQNSVLGNSQNGSQIPQSPNQQNRQGVQDGDLDRSKNIGINQSISSHQIPASSLSNSNKASSEEELSINNEVGSTQNNPNGPRKQVLQQVQQYQSPGGENRKSNLNDPHHFLSASPGNSQKFVTRGTDLAPLQQKPRSDPDQSPQIETHVQSRGIDDQERLQTQQGGSKIKPTGEFLGGPADKAKKQEGYQEAADPRAILSQESSIWAEMVQAQKEGKYESSKSPHSSQQISSQSMAFHDKLNQAKESNPPPDQDLQNLNQRQRYPNQPDQTNHQPPPPTQFPSSLHAATTGVTSPVKDPQTRAPIPQENNNTPEFQFGNNTDQATASNKQRIPFNRSSDHLYRESSQSQDWSLAQTQFHSARGDSSRIEENTTPTTVDAVQHYAEGMGFEDPQEAALNTSNRRFPDFVLQDQTPEARNRSPSLRHSSMQDYGNDRNNTTHQLTMQNVAVMQSLESDEITSSGYLANFQGLDKGEQYARQSPNVVQMNQGGRVGEQKQGVQQGKNKGNVDAGRNEYNNENENLTNKINV